MIEFAKIALRDILGLGFCLLTMALVILLAARKIP